MNFVLMAVGLLVTAAGLVTIGFGIPINAFSLGNTLIVSGTIAVATGLILIGLALVHGQLRRIAEALRNKPAIRAVEATEPVTHLAAHVAPALAPVHPSLPEPSAAESRLPPEPRFPATASEPPPGPLDWLRAKSKPVTTPVPAAPVPPAVTEPPMVDLTDEAPLSPQRAPMPAATEGGSEPKVWSPNREAGSLDSQLAPPRSEQMSRVTPQVEPPREKFDLVWPDRGVASAPSEPKVEMPKLEARIENRIETKREPALDMPLPPVPARPRENRLVTEKRMPEALRKPAERGPTILKSGVIDGMPYTLYADGSIEAQLPQGMVKFASVDALRAHLEKQS
jgi:hypothetical protein